MVEVRLRTVDSFADGRFRGNPAGVVMLDEAPSDEWMATVAHETNLSDTAFVLRTRLSDADFRLRWFTKGPVEDDLCGHATLAAAHCLFEDGVSSPIRFATRSGVLTVSRREDGSLAMDLPAWPPAQVDPPAGIADALHSPVAWTGRSGNDHLLALVADERSVRDLSPRHRENQPDSRRHRHRHCGRRPGAAVRLRVPRLRAQPGHRRGPGHRQRPYS